MRKLVETKESCDYDHICGCNKDTRKKLVNLTFVDYDEMCDGSSDNYIKRSGNVG